jgi:hypothetical protein
MEIYGNIRINCKQIRRGNVEWIHPALDEVKKTDFLELN